MMIGESTIQNLFDTSRFFTKEVYRKIAQNEGQSGFLSVSARYCDGTNVIAFKPGVLSRPTFEKVITYAIDPTKRVFEASEDTYTHGKQTILKKTF